MQFKKKLIIFLGLKNMHACQKRSKTYVDSGHEV